MKQDRFVAGEFVWTGIDYLGEPTPFDNEAQSSYFGIVDLCGIPKDRFWLYRSYWRPDEPTVHILPHWNWPDRVGQPVPVFVYTNGDSAELFLNGRSLGRRAKGEGAAAAGELCGERTGDGQLFATRHPAGTRRRRQLHPAMVRQQPRPTSMAAARPGRVATRQVSWNSASNARPSGMATSSRLRTTSASGRPSSLTRRATSRSRAAARTPACTQVDVNARYLRIEIDDVRSVPWATYWACIREVGVYPEAVESAFYDPTYDYRLRWNDVPYEPGELKAVAYRNGEKIGEATVRTAGAPAKLRLTPDRTELTATGDDLCYVLVEALDKDGVPCPLADNQVTFYDRRPGGNRRRRQRQSDVVRTVPGRRAQAVPRQGDADPPHEGRRKSARSALQPQARDSARSK